MTPKNKQTWIDALKSGEYTKAKKYLCRNDRYCSLGVGIDVLLDTWWVSDTEAPNGAWIPYGFSNFNALSDELNISHRNIAKLIQMNDNKNWSFLKIADYIKEHL